MDNRGQHIFLSNFNIQLDYEPEKYLIELLYSKSPAGTLRNDSLFVLRQLCKRLRRIGSVKLHFQMTVIFECHSQLEYESKFESECSSTDKRDW